VAVCVFFYRFRVDQEIVDLKEKIYQKDSIVKQTESLIASVEELDLKIKNAKQVLGIQSKLDGNFSYILSKISDKVVINSVEIEGLSVKLEGSAQTAESIRAFNDVIKSENKYKKVVLSNIVRDAEAFKFSMTLEDFK
jgi:Tfp pilus assembly protein PilN